MSIVSSDSKTDLIINRMTRSVYDQLCATSRLQENELYFIDDEVFDMFNKRVVNVDDPVLSTDAVNVNYLRDNFIDRSSIKSYVDNTKIYDDQYSKYVTESLIEYELIYSAWKIIVSKGNFTSSDVEVIWNPSTTSGTLNGYNLKIKGITTGTGTYSKDASEIHVDKNVSGLGDIIVDCTRSKISNKIDSYISMKRLYSCLSSIGNSSGIDEIKNSLINLNSILSTYNK